MTSSQEIIRLVKPAFSNDALESIRKILASGQLTQGVYRDRFEKQLAQVTHADRVATFNSGTSALVAALKAVGIGQGDNVAVPDYTFVATVNAVELVGARPIFVDISKDDFNLSPQALESVREPLRAIIVVHQFGIPAKLDAISKIAKQRNAIVIEDAACAIGSTYKKTPCGAGSAAGVLSFHPRKVVTTGEGGAVITNDPAIAQKAGAYSNHGFGPDGTQAEPGMNLRLPEISCALGLDQLGRLPKILEARAKIAQRLTERLGQIASLTLPAIPADNQWNHQTFAVIHQSEAKRNTLLDQMKKAGVESNVPAVSVSGLDYFANKYDTPKMQVKTSRDVARRTFSVPCHEGLTENDVARILAVF
jgi:dTDP-4-amino-4,6-dideoxygalactose transaminase